MNRKKFVCRTKKMNPVAAKPRDLDFHPSDEKKNKSGLRVNVMKSSVRSQQTKLMANLKRSCESSNVSGQTSLVKQLKELGHMFTPPNGAPKSESSKLQWKDQSATKEVIELLNYVLPIEKFNDFKVLVPKSKLQIVTEEGEKVIVEPNIENNLPNIKVNPLKDGFLKKHHATWDVLGLLKNDKSEENSTHKKWQKDSKSYIYLSDKKHLIIDRQTGKISYFPFAEKVKSNRQEKIPMLERNLYIQQFSENFDVCSHMLDYPSTNLFYGNMRRDLRDNIRISNLQPGQYERQTRGKFIVYSTKFGSFIEKLPPMLDYNNPTLRRFYKDREEDQLHQLKEKLPFHCLLDQSRLGILRNSISYIERLERKLKERLGIVDSTKLRENGVYQNTGWRPTTYNDDDNEINKSLEQLPKVTHDDAAIIIDGCLEGKRYNAMRNAIDKPFDLHNITLPLTCEEVPDTDDDVCSLVYQDFFRMLCTSQEDNSLLFTDAPTFIHTQTSFKANKEESVENMDHQQVPSLVECFSTKGCNGCEVEQARLLDQNYRNEYYCTEKIDQQDHQHHHHLSEKKNFRLNYNDVNLNTLWKKEQVLEDEVDNETEAMEGLEEPIRDEWKSATTMLFSPMSSDTERCSGFFSPIYNQDFAH